MPGGGDIEWVRMVQRELLSIARRTTGGVELPPDAAWRAERYGLRTGVLRPGDLMPFPAWLIEQDARWAR